MKQEKINEYDSFYRTLILTVQFEQTNFIANLFEFVQNFISDHSINESSINTVHVSKEFDGSMRISIEYCIIDLSSISSSDNVKAQIIAILNLLGYSEERIKSVLSQKLWNDPNQFSWSVEIYDDSSNYLYSKRDYEQSISNLLKKTLNIFVNVSIC